MGKELRYSVRDSLIASHRRAQAHPDTASSLIFTDCRQSIRGEGVHLSLWGPIADTDSVVWYPPFVVDATPGRQYLDFCIGLSKREPLCLETIRTMPS